MSRIEELVFDVFKVMIDPELLRFNEANLSEYIQTEAGHYDNYGHFLALAEKNLQKREIVSERLFSNCFAEAKSNGASDKLAEAMAKADGDVVAMKETVVDARYAVNRLKNHLRAWDKNHDNAQSLGHMLRKQMERLHGEIYTSQPELRQGRGNMYQDIPGSFGSHDEDSKVSDVGGFEDTITRENL